jgi:hypothetical protein
MVEVDGIEDLDNWGEDKINLEKSFSTTALWKLQRFKPLVLGGCVDQRHNWTRRCCRYGAVG